jgi:O-antigen ligase
VWDQNQTFGLGYYTGHRLGIPGLNAEQSNIDNTWLETLVDTGLIGCLPLALFAIGGFVRLVRVRGLRGDVRLWAVAVAAYTLLISFVNPTIQSPGAGQVVLLVLLLAGLPSTSKVPQ